MSGHTEWSWVKDAVDSIRLQCSAQDLLKALEACEWKGRLAGLDYPCCPFCEREPNDGHADGCIVKDAITKAREGGR